MFYHKNVSFLDSKILLCHANPQTSAAGAVLGKCLEMKNLFVKDKFLSCGSKVITAPVTLAISQTATSVHGV